MRTWRTEWGIPKKVGSKTSRNGTLDYASYGLNDLMANLEGFQSNLPLLTLTKKIVPFHTL